ncbi:GDP-mannose 4,6-dehydratase [Brevibacillus panacihumi]|uniref:GDP-mannose 4,6-dehydratase n=1 Tax=Brevibacillus panacihumi TaxID=497735 RepID=UPI003D045EAB
MKALITGITGFAGSHLAGYLLSRGDVEVCGTYRVRSSMELLEPITKQIHLVECELRDPHSVHRMLEEIRPNLIFHLAAQSFVPTSWNSPAETMVNNLVGQIHLLEAVRKLDLSCRIHIACSSEEYGLVFPHETPIREDNPLRPLNPYAVSKIAQDFLGYQYYQSYGMPIIRTRTFNHTGPGRGEHFVTSNFAKQIAQIELGLQPPKIFVGNLQAKRDFTDVRDIVQAYWLAATHGEPGEVYNLSSGSTYTIEEVLRILLSLTNVQVTVEVDPDRLRPSDVDTLLGDSSAFRSKTGWAPQIPFAKTMEDLLEYWRILLRKRQHSGRERC